MISEFSEDMQSLGTQETVSVKYEFSGDELLRMSGKKVDRVTVIQNDLPGEYH